LQEEIKELEIQKVLFTDKSLKEKQSRVAALSKTLTDERKIISTVAMEQE
jgi:hypothetical protein